MTWEEDEPTLHRMMQFADECIETKTITTTTTTKRSYPPLFLREPREVHTLNSKEYPLAARPTPLELRKLTFDLDEYETENWDEEDSTYAQVSEQPLPLQPEYTFALTHVSGPTVSEHRLYRQHQA
jgi:F-box and WD-40 domain protein CDC4